MTQKPENRFISAVHHYLLPDQPYREKMANPYRGGTPDVWYSGNVADLWVEYKWVAHAVKSHSARNVPLNLSALQRQWILKRFSEGRNVAVIIGCTRGGVIVTQPREFKSERIEMSTRIVLSRQEIAEWIVRETMR